MIRLIFVLTLAGLAAAEINLEEQEKHYRKLIDDKVEQLVSEMEKLFTDTSKWPQETLDALNNVNLDTLTGRAGGDPSKPPSTESIQEMLDATVPMNVVKGDCCRRCSISCVVTAAV